jgi:hypothetical protein
MRLTESQQRETPLGSDWQFAVEPSTTSHAMRRACAPVAARLTKGLCSQMAPGSTKHFSIDFPVYPCLYLRGASNCLFEGRK